MRIPRALACLALAALATACAGPGPRYGRGDAPAPRAEIGEVVAAELGFARAAAERGQWTAFADYSTPDAVMFVPQPVNAQQWLKGQANPAEPVRWQPHEVFSSCDGSLAVTRGAWQQPDGSTGYFTTAWARQRDGEYRWVLDQGDTLATPLAAPEFIASKVAECRSGGGGGRFREQSDWPRATLTAPACDATGCRGGGASADGTLRYQYTVQPDGARVLDVSMMVEGTWRSVLTSEVAAG